MTDYIIAGVVLIVIMIAIFSIKKKAKNKASCCGSGAYVAKSQKLKNHYGKENLLCRGDALPELREPCHGECAGHSRHFRIRQFEERTCGRAHGNARG